MPRSSRGSTAHRGHRTRGRHGEDARAATAVRTPGESTAVAPDVEAAEVDNPDTAPEPAPRPAAPSPQPLATTVSGTTLRGDPLLTKELIRISLLAALIFALLITLTVLFR